MWVFELFRAQDPWFIVLTQEYVDTMLVELPPDWQLQEREELIELAAPYAADMTVEILGAIPESETMNQESYDALLLYLDEVLKIFLVDELMATQSVNLSQLKQEIEDNNSPLLRTEPVSDSELLALGYDITLISAEDREALDALFNEYIPILKFTFSLTKSNKH
jgi:hypothetical protein